MKNIKTNSDQEKSGFYLFLSQKLKSLPKILREFFNNKFSLHLFHHHNFDEKTFKTIRKISNHNKISIGLKFVCYMMICCGIIIYIANFMQKSSNIKLIKNIKNKSESPEIEKIMTNPRIVISDDGNKSYLIKAKIARHLSAQEVQLEEVYAEGKIGKISAGELKIEEEGNHLIFSKNPTLILE